MPTFVFTGPDGKDHEIEGPPGSTPEQALAKLQTALKQQPQGNYVDNIVRRIASGATFGFADEFAAKMNELTGRGDYASNVAQERARDALFQQSNPVAATTAEIAGGFMSPATKLIGSSVAATSLPRYAKYFVEGATLGGLAGAGNSTEGNRITGTAIGGTLGGGLGVALPAAAEGVGKFARSTLERIMSGETTPAARRLGNAFVRDELTIPAAQARLSELGPNATLADLGGNVRGLAEVTAQMPGKALTAAEDTLKVRAATQGERIIQSAFQSTGVNSIDDLILKRATEARPLYERAFSWAENKFGAGINSPTIERLLQRPAVQEGLKRGVNIIKNEDSVTGNPSYFSDMIFDGESLSDPNVVSKLVPNLRLLDAAKRGLDDILQSGGDSIRNPTTNSLTQYGRSIEGMRKALVDELDRATIDPQTGKSFYKAARDAWAGPSPLIEALSHIDDVVSKARDSSDITGRLFGSPAAREKLKALFPDDQSFSAFAKTIKNEKTFAETSRQVLGNSRTAFRQAAQDDLQAGTAAEAALNIAQNPSIGTILGQGVQAARRAMTSPPTAVADELAPMLFSTDPAVKAQALQLLQQRVNAGTMLNRFNPAARIGLLGGARIGGYSGGLLGGSNQ